MNNSTENNRYERITFPREDYYIGVPLKVTYTPDEEGYIIIYTGWTVI